MHIYCMDLQVVVSDIIIDVNDKNTENSTPNGILDRGENSTDIAKEGVEVYVYTCEINLNGVRYTGRIPMQEESEWKFMH